MLKISMHWTSDLQLIAQETQQFEKKSFSIRLFSVGGEAVLLQMQACVSGEFVLLQIAVPMQHAAG